MTETGDADAAGNSLPKLFLVRERPCECVVRLGVRASRVGDCATPASQAVQLEGCCCAAAASVASARQKSSSSGEEGGHLLAARRQRRTRGGGAAGRRRRGLLGWGRGGISVNRCRFSGWRTAATRAVRKRRAAAQPCERGGAAATQLADGRARRSRWMRAAGTIEARGGADGRARRGRFRRAAGPTDARRRGRSAPASTGSSPFGASGEAPGACRTGQAAAALQRRLRG